MTELRLPGSLCVVAENSGADPDSAAERDAQWFRDHPDEDRLLRSPMQGELGPFSVADFWIVEVVQIKPGIRRRRLVARGESL